VKSGSLSSGKFSLFFSLNEACAFTESPLAPRITTPSLSNCFFASRNSDASTVQPEVLAFGKKKRITRLPRKSDRDTSLPSSAFRRNSGALSPTLSMCPPQVKLGQDNNLRKTSLTACGLAWPRVARITWPTKNLHTPSFPALYLATFSGFFSMTSRPPAPLPHPPPTLPSPPPP